MSYHVYKTRAAEFIQSVGVEPQNAHVSFDFAMRMLKEVSADSYWPQLDYGSSFNFDGVKFFVDQDFDLIIHFSAVH